MAKKPDRNLLIIISALILWGMFTLATVSFPFSLEKYGNSWHYIVHQLLYGLIPGIILAYIFFRMDLKLLKKASVILFALNVVLLLLVFLPKIGVEINGARRWLNLGFLFQPSEFLKITFLLYLAAWLSGKSRKREKWHAPFVFLIMIAILGAIILLQPDMSTFMLIFLIGFIVYFASSTPWWHSLVIILLSGGVGAGLIFMAPYRLNRVLTLFSPQTDPLGLGYQLKQSLIAIGSGRIFGINGGFNLGLSVQKFGFLPHPMSDSIFAIIGEELGFIGAIALIILFLLLLYKGIKMGLKTNNGFVRLLAVGISSWLCFQAFFNVCGIIGILPLAGIPLPFFSYGSSHLITEMIGVGILLNISRNVH